MRGGPRNLWSTGMWLRRSRKEYAVSLYPFAVVSATSDALSEVSTESTAFDGGKSTLRAASARRSLSAFAPLTSISCSPGSPSLLRRVGRSSRRDAGRTGGLARTCDGFHATHWQGPDAERSRATADR